MPSVSAKQHRLMAAVATNPAVAKKTKIPQSVGKEFMEADRGKKFKGGGEMKESKAMVKKEIGFMKKKGAPKSMIKHEMKEAGMKNGDKVKKMALGGMTANAARGMGAKSTQSQMQAAVRAAMGAKNQNAASPFLSPRARAMKAAPPAYGKNPAPAGATRSGPLKEGGAVKKYAAGGLAAGHKAADGVAVKGKTKAKQVKMAYGGKC